MAARLSEFEAVRELSYRKMRILQIVGSLNRGGAETWLVQALHCLDRRKYQVDFLVLGLGPYDLQAEVESLGCRVIPSPAARTPLAFSGNFIRVLRRFGPYDCVHCHVHYFSGLPLLLARMAGVPIRIVQSHTDLMLQDGDSIRLRRLYAWTMKRMIWLTATRGAAVSRRAGDALFPPDWQKKGDRWSTLPLGINLRPFAGVVDQQAVRQELGIPPEAFVVGHVGSFRRAKNHSFLVDVAYELVKLAPNSCFLLIGDGPLRSETERRVFSQGLSKNFIFAGVRSDVARLLMGAVDAFLFPSLYEGLGMAVLEAQAAGLPCLISDAVPEEADTGGGLVVRVSLEQSPADWAKRLLSLPGRNKNSGSGQAKPAGVPAIEHSTQRLIELYTASGL